MLRTLTQPSRVHGSYRYSTPRARAAAELTGEESKYPPARCTDADCTEPAKAGCGGFCARCWKQRRALAHLY